jgi:hypothetical protein
MSDASDTKDGLRAILRDLVALHGVSGFEQPLVAYFEQRATGLADQVDVDRYGNVTAVKRGRHDRPRLMLSAHLDEIGFIVRASSRPASFASTASAAPPTRSCSAVACRSMAISASLARRPAISSRVRSRRGPCRPPTSIST